MGNDVTPGRDLKVYGEVEMVSSLGVQIKVNIIMLNSFHYV